MPRPGAGTKLQPVPATPKATEALRKSDKVMRDLADRVEDGRLDLKRLPELADEDVIAELIQIKGVGQWTAEVFVMFHLGRPDVLPVGDLGVRRAVQLAYGLEELPGPEELRRI